MRVRFIKPSLNSGNNSAIKLITLDFVYIAENVIYNSRIPRHFAIDVYYIVVNIINLFYIIVFQNNTS